MAVFSGIGATLTAVAAGLGVASTAVGTYMSYKGQQQAADAQEKAERIRTAQLELESKRQTRQILRQAAIARGQALTNAVTQGASGGSGIQGGLGQINTGAAENVSAVNDARSLGTGIFAANAQAARGQSLAATGAGISSLGGTMISASGAIGRLGGFAGGGGTVGAPLDIRPSWMTG